MHRQPKYEKSTEERFNEISTLVKKIADDLGLSDTYEVHTRFSSGDVIKVLTDKSKKVMRSVVASNQSARRIHSFPNVWTWRWKIVPKPKKRYQARQQYSYASFRIEFPVYEWTPYIKVKCETEKLSRGTVTGVAWSKLKSEEYLRSYLTEIAFEIEKSSGAK